MITFKSVGHFFANAVKKLLAAEPVIVAAGEKVEATQQEVTSVSEIGRAHV